jgi:hypothetical protein
MIIPTYATLADKANHFDAINIENKTDLDNLIEEWTKKDNNKTIIFRGLTEAKYKLINSAQRFWNGEELDRLGRSYEEFIQTEIDKAKGFHNRLLEKFYDAFGHPAYDLSILSFLQHYKAPTPLLDFTYNFDSALFFATDGLKHNPSVDIDNYCSIYAIDTKAIPREFPSIISHIKSSLSQIDNILIENKGKRFNATNVLKNFESLQYKTFHGLTLFYIPGYTPAGIRFTLRSRPNFKLVYNQHNLNIINQKGLFVFNSDPTHPLEDFFSGGYGTGFQSTFQLPKIKCWNIHKSLNEYIVRHLTENRPIPIDKEYMYPQEEFIASSAYKQFKSFK